MTSSTANNSPVRVRIAPSPTGDPHVGTAYIALFNYAFAKQNGGSFVLRIEDTDRTRARADSEAMILDALKWVGLSWDEGPDVGGPYGPYKQSERLPIYADHAQKLIENGKAYRCFCTAERLATLREEQKKAGASNFGYDRLCRSLSGDEALRRANAGESFVVRLAVPLGQPVKFHDELRGDVEIAATQIDDQVLLKTDGFPTYHLANVVDDYLMKITHVIRAEEWISSTPKHVLLYQAFGWEAPKWHHMPLLRNSDKSKISKRKNPVSIHYYRDIGILPEALLNFLANMGWSFGGDREKFTLHEMIDVFAWDKVSLGGPVFNQEKLQWLNELYIHDLTIPELAQKFIAWRLSQKHLESVLPLMQKRIKKLSDFIPAASFFFAAELDYATLGKELEIPEVPGATVKKHLLALVEAYDALDGFVAKEVETATRAYCEQNNLAMKHWFMLLRLGITGKKASPGLFETMEVVGKEICRMRLRELATFVAAKR